MCKKLFSLFFFLFPLISYAEPTPAQIGAPYYFTAIQGSGNSPEELISKWWSGYNTEAYLSKYGIKVGECDYTVTPLTNGNLVKQVTLTGRCQGGGQVSGTWICPAGSTYVATGKCDIKYDVAVDDDEPPPSCPVGNPLDVSTGFKYQTETDVPARGVGQVSFLRYYSNAQLAGQSLWKHQYDKRIVVLDPTVVSWQKKKSNGHYSSQSAACTSGWAEIKSSVTDSWAVGGTAVYNNGQCQIVKNGSVVRILPIVPANLIYSYLTPGAVHLYRPDGSTISHQYYGQTFLSLNGDHGQLELINRDTWRYKAKDGTVEEYSHDGKLAAVISTNGIKQSLVYDAVTGTLSSVEDSVGGKLNFSYVDGRLANVTTNDNKTTAYSYNALGLIADVQRPDNTHRMYHYEKTTHPTFLTGITDERGARYATWDYDSQGRGILSEHAGGAERVSLSFNADGSTTVKNALNKNTKYEFADVAGVRRVIKVTGEPTANCAGANQDYTYTPQGWLASKTDWKGIKTTYQYNSKGQEISRTEAYGTPQARTITTEWHPTLYLKTKITESNRETLFTYSEQGLLTKQQVKNIAAQ